MKVLAYCITEAEFESPDLRGVASAEVGQFVEGELRCFVSQHEIFPTTEMQRAALEYYHVLSTILSQVALIPFRFPTLLADTTELIRHIRERYEDYDSALERLRDAVQMEARISFDGAPEQAPEAASGREYLQARGQQLHGLEAAAAVLKHAVAPWVLDWRQRMSAHGLRCYVLVNRKSIKDFQRTAADVSSRGSHIHVSGPWPASEFLEPQ